MPGTVEAPMKYRFAVRSAQFHGPESAHQTLEHYHLQKFGGVPKTGHVIDRSVERRRRPKRNNPPAWKETIREWDWPKDPWVEVEISFDDLREFMEHVGDRLIVAPETPIRDPQIHKRDGYESEHTFTWMGDPRAEYRILIYDTYIE